MTLQDAIKSRKPFKRMCHKTWLVTKKLYAEDDESFCTEDKELEVIILPSGVLAEDWEIRWRP